MKDCDDPSVCIEEAYKTGNLDTIKDVEKQVYKKHGSFTKQDMIDFEKDRALIGAIRSSNIDLVKHVMSTYKNLLAIKRSLKYSFEVGNQEIIDYLIEIAKKVDEKHKDFSNTWGECVMYASKYGYVKELEMMLKNPVDQEIIDLSLMEACSNSQVETVQILLRKRITSIHGKALMGAYESGNSEIIRMIINRARKSNMYSSERNLEDAILGYAKSSNIEMLEKVINKTNDQLILNTALYYINKSA